MALTPEQQAQIDFQEAQDARRRASDMQVEADRHAKALELINAQAAMQQNALLTSERTQVEAQARQMRLEALRMAKETLIENARSKPVDARDVSAADIQAFAQTLVSYING